MKFPPLNPDAQAVADLARARFLAATQAPEAPNAYVAYREAADDAWTDAYERELTARGLRAAAPGLSAGHRRAIPLPAARPDALTP